MKAPFLISACMLFLPIVSNQVAEAATKYKACAESDRKAVFGGLTNELQSCSEVSNYDLTSDALPTNSQRLSICKCADLVKRVSELHLPRCSLVLSGSSLSFKDAVASIFTECSITEPQEVPDTSAPAESISFGSSDTISAATSTMSVSVSGSDSGEAGGISSFSLSSSSSTSGSELDIEDQDIQKPATEPANEGLDIQDQVGSPTRTPASTKVSATSTVEAISGAGIALAAITAYAMA